MKNRFFMFFVIISMYYLSYFYRVSTAVISPDLMRDFAITAEALGLLSGFYFYTFAAAQFPLGPILDKYGPRRTVVFFSIFTIVGSLMFALSPTYMYAVIGRALIGLGVSCAYMATLKFLSIWFSRDQFGTMSAFSMAIGNIGALTATVPLAILSNSIGWRNSFVLITFVTLISAILIWKFVEDKELPRSEQSSEKKGFLLILRNKNFWIVAIMQFFWFGTFVGIQGLWGGPFLMDVFGLTKTEAGKIISMIAIGFIFGGPFMGYISDKVFRSRKWVVIAGLSIFMLILVLLTKTNDSTAKLTLYLLFFIYGFFGSAGIIGYSHAKERFPLSQAGTVMSWINFFAIFGAAVFQHVMGMVLDFYGKQNGKYPIEAYKATFFICIAGILISLILYFLSDEKDS
ncbi:MAG: MFS transporter [Calditerrivibrio sp.]|nr:MFS transporter [Calditerrivibrio sp.]